MTQSATVARVRATGRASPAKPPIDAPTPVGTIRTVVYGLLNCIKQPGFCHIRIFRDEVETVKQKKRYLGIVLSLKRARSIAPSKAQGIAS
jgi:hypothetical protein